MAGIRGGDGAFQNFLRVDGAITADSEGVKSAPGLDTNTTYWWKLVKDIDTYTCYRSADGENFTEMFSYADTGIEADYIILDAYTGMTEGYAFTAKSLTFDAIEGTDEPCQHDYEAVVTEPTCTEIGFTTYTCAKCGDKYAADETEALGHKWDDGVVTKEPTPEEDGVMTFTCTVCGATMTKKLPVTGPCCPSEIFTDVPDENHWAHEGIDYAVENGLMKGISEDKFNPGGTLTRAELVTILYREAGSPEAPYKGIFADVKDDQWYTDAVEWAATNKIVNGVGDGTNFAPSDTITREQIATILYRYSGEPEVKGDLKAFPDAAKVSSFATVAMAWAVENKIITGASVDGVTYLKPLDSATREQIASIIMRYLEGE